MTENEDLKSNIPAYLAGTLGGEEKKKIDDELALSEELRGELNFWRKIQRLVHFESSQKEVHLTPDQIVDYIEDRIRKDERGSVEKHLASCKPCREETDALKETYPSARSRHVQKEFSIIRAIVEYFTPPRLAYALGAVGFVLAAVATILLISKPDWENIRDSADSMLRDNNLKGAEEKYQEALAVLKLETKEYPFETASLFDSLAVINARAGYAAGSQYFLEQSLAIRQKNIGRDDRGLAWVFDRLGTIERSRGNFAGAETLFRKADGIRELLAENHPEDPDLSGYRRKSRSLALIPQTIFRGPDQDTKLPALGLEEDITHVSMLIALRQSRPRSIYFLPSVTTPSQRTLSVPDTLALDPVDESGKSLRLVLSKRYFEEGTGTYRLTIKEFERTETGLRDGAIHSYSFRVAK